MKRSFGRRLSIAVALLAVGGTAMLWRYADASFSGKATNGANALTTGSVTLSNSSTSPVINVSGPIPGSYGTSCLTTTYTGSLPAEVRLYLPASGLSGSLGSYLTLQIKESTGSCAGFTSTATLYNPNDLNATAYTVAAFSAASNSYATGVSRWIATTSATRSYQFNWQLQDDNIMTSKSATIAFTWEARST
ncbi:hypothetical protein [Paractinoplanes lichenicola]|uniref:Camelysin metallo-endopeptidase n=1 Tax=Paractinoplanes lichenicola TaxID=2802976 RepID=A0ABS1VIF1_9ACTN|nr:hypothetical protein [Actinoplanes lichenicola]MBL7253246.1 hypothetical protein [Actinoplanes lichenicola]